MARLFIVANLLVAFSAFTALAQELERDTIETSAGDLKITFIGHGTLMFTFGGKVIHIDPWSRLADYSKMPKADIILLTHEHRDHLDQGGWRWYRDEEWRYQDCGRIKNRGCASL